MKIIFRTNFGKDIGLGHLYRSLSLAYAIKETIGPEILFILNKKTDIIKDFPFLTSRDFDYNDIKIIKGEKPDIIVFDSYLATKDYLIQLRNIAKLVMFDDNNDIYGETPSHILINGNLHAKILEYKSLFGDTKFLLGPKYLVMKPEYWKGVLNKDISEDAILITTGGADTHRLMPKFMKSLKLLNIKKQVIISPAFEEEEIREIENLKDDNYELIYKPLSLKKYIQMSKIVITAAGSTIYEVLTLHRPPVIYIMADNQRKIAQILKKYKVIDLGWHENINWKGLRKLIESLLDFYLMDKTLYNLFDGKGALRVAREILSIGSI